MFWTIRNGPASTEATLCEDCALIETNIALAYLGLEGFESMSEAATILSSLLAAIGDSTDHFTSSDFGYCPCGKRNAS